MYDVDGQLVPDLGALRRPRTPAPFETMGAEGGELPLWPHHLRRLQAAAVRLGLPFVPNADLLARSKALLLHNGHADDVLRLCLVPHEGRVHQVLESRARGPRRKHGWLVPCVTRRPAGAPPGDLKAMPRSFYDAVRQEAQDGGADDGIVLGDDGAVLETTIANLWLCLDGVWVTPALNGSVLPGIARGLLLERAGAHGVAVAERRCDLGDLHRASALCCSNAVSGVTRVSLLGGEEAVEGPAHRELLSLWQQCRSG